MKGRSLLIGGILAALLSGGAQAGISPELYGMASFGADLGVMQWLADSDARSHAADEFGAGGSARPRPIGNLAFRYRKNETWALAVNGGFGWSSYPDSDNLIMWVLPLTAGLERRIGEFYGATMSLGFGGGFYTWAVRRNGRYIIDSETQQRYIASDPGLYGGLVGEFNLSPNVTLISHLKTTFIYSAHSDDFKAAYGGSDLYADFRVGLNYYFDTYEGFIRGEAEEGR